MLCGGGQWLIRISFLCFSAGALVIKLFFPHLLGQGLGTVALAILVPIYSSGGVGILLVLYGWLHHPALDADFDASHFGFEQPPHAPVFGWLTKSLALLVASLLFLSGLALLALPDDSSPLVLKAVTCYCMAIYCGFTWYLVLVYDRARHLATNTYLNRLTPLLAILLVPITWPLLILLNRIVRKRIRTELRAT